MLKSFLIAPMTLLIAGFVMGQPNQKITSTAPLNHFYIVLNSETYKAIEQDPFLRGEFAVTELRTTTRTDISYTGAYFYGTNTYFEFFDAATTSIGKLSDSGIALGVDQAGTLEAFRSATGTNPPNSKLSLLQSPITRGFAGKQVPWFYMAVPTNIPADAGLRFWVMEYHPSFLNEWNAQPDVKNPGVRRRDILKRYATVLKDTPRKPYFQDVVAITLALNKATTRALLELGQLLGYRERISETTTTLTGQDIELRIIPETPTERGIRQITMRVNGKPAKQSEFQFGKSVLSFRGNGLATWTF
ncbi:MAG: DUF5829 family protein [Acidobacteriota bacterium]